ncbi:uncharacterized protein LOC123196175 [Mangifera indica]|uniref:uncharacterized protein LOC123196175 n=1 Tax=Mangifera indica TaxID=29780 RepID=UPI001CFAB56B|nr:uncharacterized protein LOC123196175 [Mangifera indica]XP_044466014.1 uncharacterized protein LOC123196175 [Mangifera indica]
MGKDNDTKCAFRLTSLQIGDLQSYLSDLCLFLAFESKKIYILVDNRPWLVSQDSRPTHLWQLMVTKSRLSPFANTKARRQRKEGKDSCTTPGAIKSEKVKRWFSLIDAVTLSQKRALLPVKTFGRHLLLISELHRTLYGFIVFEVSWTDVRGINYYNELQTDTSLAIEAKFMRRWEFDSIAQAATCISSWFSGKHSEHLQLRDYLYSAIGEIFYDAEEDFWGATPKDDDENICSENQYGEDTSTQCITSMFSAYAVTTESRTSEPLSPPLTEPYKRRKVMKCNGDEFEVEDLLCNSETCTECDIAAKATQYRDVLILFRFNDPHLPFKLRKIIMSDLRLLTLLEAGLPSWVIFLQSYPGFCHLYRPWMCPLARALYVLISAVTVLIGFYDLYKNVPVLKAAASRFCGPLLDWIETWDMVSRIKYLGTMLFLQNFQKAVQWFLAITRTIRSFFLFVTLPMAEPLMEVLNFLLPLWNALVQVVESSCSIIWVLIGSSCSLIGDLMEIVLLPIWLIISFIWNIANFVLCPIFWMLWEMLFVPIRLVLALASFMAFIFAGIFELLADIWRAVSGIFQLSSASKATVSTYEVSMWRSLWNDLFSQVFRALRSILNGFVAFFMACNRHRLSIYNHIQEFIQRLLGQTQRPQPSDLKQSNKQVKLKVCLKETLQEVRS